MEAKIMKTLTRTSNIIYSFSKEHEPVLTVESGETVEIETFDCFEDQIQSNEQKLEAIDWNRINPATGPIYVNGAEKGDTLKVTIEKIEIGNQGVIATGENLGMLGDELKGMTMKVVQVEDNHVIFNEDIKIPLNPMIGVIGVAPEGEAIPTGTPGSHGGNMDTKLICEGATIYFPVFTEGALFGLGDFHAAMGDGEIGGSGVEVPGKATVKIEVIKNKTIEHPVIENENGLAFLVSSETVDEAIQLATKQAVHFLSNHTNLSVEDATLLLSAAGQVEISQVVDPLLTARFIIPKYILEEYDLNFSDIK